jgi:hypothetical protein
MKNILLALFLIAVPVSVFTQNRALNKFYRQYKKGNDVQNMKVPGWLIRFGGKIAKKHVDSKEEKLALDLLKNFGAVRFMYSEDESAVPGEAVEKLRKDLLKDQFDDLIMIRDGEMNLQMMIREEGDVIKNFFMLYNDTEDGEMVFISAKTSIHLQQLSELIEASLKKKTEEFFEEKPEEPVAEPVL